MSSAVSPGAPAAKRARVGSPGAAAGASESAANGSGGRGGRGGRGAARSPGRGGGGGRGRGRGARGRKKAAPAPEEDDYSSESDADPPSAELDNEDEERLRRAADARERAMFAQLTDAQAARYEAFRRSRFDRAMTKDVIREALAAYPALARARLSDRTAVVVAGAAKVFLGELVERARLEMERLGESGPLHPRHLREAWREAQEAGRWGGGRRKRLLE